jgi:hypothetical protein
VVNFCATDADIRQALATPYELTVWPPPELTRPGTPQWWNETFQRTLEEEVPDAGNTSNAPGHCPTLKELDDALFYLRLTLLARETEEDVIG